MLKNSVDLSRQLQYKASWEVVVVDYLGRVDCTFVVLSIAPTLNFRLVAGLGGLVDRPPFLVVNENMRK